jgi:hypothetical protein
MLRPFSLLATRSSLLSAEVNRRERKEHKERHPTRSQSAQRQKRTQRGLKHEAGMRKILITKNAKSVEIGYGR